MKPKDSRDASGYGQDLKGLAQMLDAGQLLFNCGRRGCFGLRFWSTCNRMESTVNEKTKTEIRHCHADAIFKISNAHASLPGALNPQPFNLIAL